MFVAVDPRLPQLLVLQCPTRLPLRLLDRKSRNMRHASSAPEFPHVIGCISARLGPGKGAPRRPLACFDALRVKTAPRVLDR